MASKTSPSPKTRPSLVSLTIAMLAESATAAVVLMKVFRLVLKSVRLRACETSSNLTVEDRTAIAEMENEGGPPQPRSKLNPVPKRGENA